MPTNKPEASKMPLSPIERVIMKMLPVGEDGAKRTLDDLYGFPETFLVTLTSEEIGIVLEALEMKSRVDSGTWKLTK